MTRPVHPAQFARAGEGSVAPAAWARLADGLPEAIDDVAATAPESHAMLRRQWFVAAIARYGGAARTLLAGRAPDTPQLALPIVAIGPRALKLVAVPGCYWPFRSFPAEADCAVDVFGAALDALGSTARAIRIGPVYDGDAAVGPLLLAARARGWGVLDRFVARSFLLDMARAGADDAFPRGSTLRKNRFHEKHLAAHGALDWSFHSGADWSGELIDALAQVEQASWIAQRTDGSDAKFTDAGHGGFWREAAKDPAIAERMWVALLRIDGRPAAFSFDINAGSLKYAIANSYDPAFAKHSPGKLLYYRNLVRAIADGITHVDWGAGDSGYKKVIGAAPGPAIRDWLLVRPGIDAAIARLLGGAWRRSGHAET